MRERCATLASAAESSSKNIITTAPPYICSGKTGVALLLGGGLSNLYDRYTKGHVVDYFHINIGPKRLRNIIFNISDFCVFIGALLAVAGAETAQRHMQ